MPEFCEFVGTGSGVRLIDVREPHVAIREIDQPPLELLGIYPAIEHAYDFWSVSVVLIRGDIRDADRVPEA